MSYLTDGITIGISVGRGRVVAVHNVDVGIEVIKGKRPKSKGCSLLWMGRDKRNASCVTKGQRVVHSHAMLGLTHEGRGNFAENSLLKTVTRVLMAADCRAKTEDRRLKLNEGWYWSESVVSKASVVTRWRLQNW